MRALAILASLALVLAAGCIKEEPVDSATIEDAPPPEDTAPEAPTPTTPTSAPPASNPPPPATTPPPPPAEEPPAPAPPAPRVDVETWNGSLTAVGAGATTPAGAEICCAQVAPANSNADIEFDVPSGLKGIVVEIVWADPQFDLDLIVTAADYDVTPSPPEPYTGHRWYAGGGAPAQPEGKTTIVITDADALAITGTWSAHAGAKGPANAVAFTLFVSLFYDEAPATDYTATA